MISTVLFGPSLKLPTASLNLLSRLTCDTHANPRQLRLPLRVACASCKGVRTLQFMAYTKELNSWVYISARFWPFALSSEPILLIATEDQKNPNRPAAFYRYT